MDVLGQAPLGFGVLCVFYGMLLVISLHCAGVARVLGQREYASYAAYFAASLLYVAQMPGGAARTIWPSHADWFDYLELLSGALALMAALRVIRDTQRTWPSTLGFCAALAGALLSLLARIGVLTVPVLGAFAVPIGLTVQGLLLAAALARTINDARTELNAVSGALSSELSAVSLALRTAEEASQRAERATRVRDEFIATMSHEFRTPLNPIINIPQGMRAEFVRVSQAQCGQCQAIFELEPGETVSSETACPDCHAVGSLQLASALSFSGDPARARTLLTKVEHSGEHLLRVVNSILDYSKMEAHQLKLLRERFDACALVCERVADLDEAARRVELQLTLVCEQRPMLVFADPHRIGEVLTHLIDNAIKFRRGPGTIVVTLREEGPKLVFSVTDQGIGIAKEHLEHVFTSFEQVSKGNTRSHGGTGLGLSMARSLVQMHGGEIIATSEVNVGSSFRFWIPNSARGSVRSLKRLSLGAST